MEKQEKEIMAIVAEIEKDPELKVGSIYDETYVEITYKGETSVINLANKTAEGWSNEELKMFIIAMREYKTLTPNEARERSYWTLSNDCNFNYDYYYGHDGGVKLMKDIPKTCTPDDKDSMAPIVAALASHAIWSIEEGSHYRPALIGMYAVYVFKASNGFEVDMSKHFRLSDFIETN